MKYFDRDLAVYDVKKTDTLGLVKMVIRDKLIIDSSKKIHYRDAWV